MNSIDRRIRFALCTLVSALSIAAGAAGKTPDSAQTSPAATAAAPASPAPASNPPVAPEDPAPPTASATAPQPSPAPAQAAPSESGQWVYTSQYGWVWMPYAARYTYVSADGNAAYMYIYAPADGWRWVSAPWLLGWGPRPDWGAFGPARFAWYAHPWFRVGFAHGAPWHAHFWHQR